MNDTDITIAYLVSRLDPDARGELQMLLGGTDTGDLAEDAIKVRIAMDRLPPRLMRQVSARLTTDKRDADRKGFAERYPEAGRLK